MLFCPYSCSHLMSPGLSSLDNIFALCIQHKSSIKHSKHRNQTELSSLIWSLTDKGTDYKLTWNIIDRARPYRPGETHMQPLHVRKLPHPCWNEPYQEEDRVAQQVPPPPKILGAKPQAIVSRVLAWHHLWHHFWHFLTRFCVCVFKREFLVDLFYILLLVWRRA